jgi:hypothetical protein
MSKHKHSIDSKVVNRIYGHGKGWVFTPAHFTDLGSRDAVRLQPSGAYAANLLGLSAQVPMKIVYLTDGRSRTVQIGKKHIILKQTTPRNMAMAGRISGLVIQALRHLGRHHVDDAVIARLDRRLNADDRKQLLKDIRFAPAWIADIMRHLGTKEEKIA